jgi:hypothetical protein
LCDAANWDSIQCTANGCYQHSDLFGNRQRIVLRLFENFSDAPAAFNRSSCGLIQTRSESRESL